MSTDYSDDRVRIRQLFRNESEMRYHLALRTKMFRTLRPTRVIWRDFGVLPQMMTNNLPSFSPNVSPTLKIITPRTLLGGDPLAEWTNCELALTLSYEVA
jgi:hypothetical protein